MYGHISTWETGRVTDMTHLFCGDSYDYSGAGYCNTAAASFNEDIGAYDIYLSSPRPRRRARAKGRSRPIFSMV